MSDKRSLFFNRDHTDKKDPTVPLRDILIYNNDYLKECENQPEWSRSAIKKKKVHSQSISRDFVKFFKVLPTIAVYFIVFNMIVNAVKDIHRNSQL